MAWFLTHGDWPPMFTLHSCDNPPCCNPAHLSAGTPRENVEDAQRKGRHIRGERVGSARLTESDVMAIRSSPKGAVALGREYGVSASTICDIRFWRTWRHVA
jgi:hypothetical protein